MSSHFSSSSSQSLRRIVAYENRRKKNCEREKKIPFTIQLASRAIVPSLAPGLYNCVEKEEQRQQQQAILFEQLAESTMEGGEGQAEES